MSILSAPAVSTKPIPVAEAGQDPWTDRPTYAVDKAALVFGARVRHRTIPGLFEVVRGPERSVSTRPYMIRVREQAGDGSLVGAVLSWTLREVAGLVTDEPAPAKVEEIVPEPSAPTPAKPLVVAMAISIDGTHYGVSPLAPSPDATKAFRFVKVGGDGRAYDVEELAGGARCDCADFVFRREGLDPLGCKHIRAAWICGLIAEYAAIPAPRDAYAAHRDKLAELAAAEDVVRREGEARQVEDVPCCEPSATPCAACLDAPTPPPELGWDPTIGVEEDEDPRYGPQDDGGSGWDAYDDDRWTITGSDADDPEPMTLPAWLDLQAENHRRIGGAKRVWLAGKLAALAEQARFLDATTPAAFDDRLDAMLDAEAARVEARHAAAACR